MAGDASAQGGDRSAADMALCSHLAFWCAGDAERMDRIFRRSGLMRDKWDARRGGSTYGAQTIGRAVAGCTEFYRPRASRRAGRPDAAPSGGSPASGPNVCSLSSDAAHARGSGPAPGPETGPEAAFDPDRPPSAGPWLADGDGALWAVGADGSARYMVSSTAPWVAADLVDVDTGDVRALVRVATPAGVRERALDREGVLSQNRIVGALAPLGANVSSSNAKDIVRYLTDCERAYGAARPRERSVTHLGWAEGPLTSFMPYDAGAGVRFDPAADGLAKARPFMEPAGTLAAWVAGMAPQRAASPAFRAMLAASFASVLVDVVGVQPFIVYLWGRSRSGKTPSLKAAGSVWGDPTEGAEGYFRTFADTPKSIVRAAALLHDIPLIVDELQAKGAPGGQAGKRQLVEDLLYSLSLGRERGALNSDRTMMRTGSWRSLTIATGEIPIVGDATQQGAANRTLELNAEPFADPRDAQAMHRLVGEQHGTAGRAFVAALRGNPVEFYRDQFAAVRDVVSAGSGGHPQADNASLLAFADALASYYVFGPGAEWSACLEGGYRLAAWALAHATGAEAGDTDLKAMQFVSEWLARGAVHFQRYCEDDRVERWGEYEEFADRPGGRYWVFSSVLDRALAEAGFDRQKTLRRMADEGALAPAGTGRGYTRQRRFGGIRVRCLVIDGPALEAAIEGRAVSASQGDGTC